MNKILNFPEGYPDEDFRSVVYRYHIRAGNVSMDETNNELFDVKSAKLLQFPRKLSTLLEQLPFGHNLTEDHFLSNTWFPLISPFLPKERLSLVYNDILNGDGPKYVGRIVSQRQLPILSKEIKYCPLCVEQDYEVYGESYLHLSHQLSFIKICPKHKVTLYESCPDCGSSYSNKEQGSLTVIPCCKGIEIQHESVDEVEELKIKLKNEMVYFRNNSINLSHGMLHSKIMILLGAKGYIDIKGNIEKQRLIKDLEGYYKRDFLNEIVGSKDTYLLTKTSLYNFLNPDQMTRFILLYFLVILFLSGSVKNFLDVLETFSCPIPFGTGPWECYNSICSSYEIGLPIIKCKRTYIYKGNFKGYFLCPVCGYEYARKWSLTDKENDKISVTEMGHLWQMKVKRLFDDGYKIPYIAKILKSKESRVRSFIKKIDMNVVETKIDATIENLKVRELYRAKVKTLLETNDNFKRIDIKRRAYKEYRWLIKNDNEWFNLVLPPSRGKRQPLDYEAVDIELISKVRKAAEKVYAINPPTRIKATSIINKLNPTDRSRINNYHNKLPGTIKELGLLVESIDEYQIRHTPVLFSKIMNSGEYRRVTFKSLCSHRKSYNKCTAETRKKIEEILNELQKNNP